MEYCELFEARSFDGERLKIIQKQGTLIVLTERWGKLNQMERSPRRMERDGNSVK